MSLLLIGSEQNAIPLWLAFHLRSYQLSEDIGCSLNMYNTDAHISARTEELPIRHLVNFLPTLNASFSICFCLLLVAFWSSNTEEEAALILLSLAWPASTNKIKSILYEPNV